MIGRRGLASSTNPQGAPTRRRWKDDLSGTGGDGEAGPAQDARGAAAAAGVPATLGLGSRLSSSSASAPPGVEQAGQAALAADGSEAEDAGDGAAGGDDRGSAKRRREKEFAWMDSEDESGGEAGSDASPSSPSRKVARPSGEDGDDKAQAEAVNVKLEEVQTFAAFVRITPALTRDVANLSADQLAALCATAARLRYFDGDLFREVYKALVRHFAGGEVDSRAATDIAQHLADLNAYDEQVFSAAIASMAPRIEQLHKELRLRWLSILEQVRHTSSPSFVEALRSAPVLEDIPVTISSGGRMPCRHYSRGFCSLGRGCTFSHDAGLVPLPMVSPTVLTQMQSSMEKRGGPFAGRPACRRFARGLCTAGQSCGFPHVLVQCVPPPPVMPIGLYMPPPPPQHPMLKPPPRPPPANVKTKVCIHYAAGTCTWGANCHFLHVVRPVSLQ